MALIDSSRVAEISQKFALLTPTMDERQTRLWLAAEATAIGRGGLAAVTAATGVLRKRIGMGIRELERIITADAGGSNGYRTRLWKSELQKLEVSDEE